MRKIIAAIGVIVIAALVCLWVVQRKELGKLQERFNTLTAQSQELDALRAENEELKDQKITSAELRRLRQAHLELMSLRAATKVGAPTEEEKAAVKAAREAMLAAIRESVTNSPETNAPDEEMNNSFYLFKSSVQAVVAENATLVSGGWSDDNGTRYLVFATPMGAEESKVALQAHLIGASEKVWTSLGLDAVKVPSQESALHLTLTPEQANTVLTNLLGASSDVNVVTSPRAKIPDNAGTRMASGSYVVPLGENIPVYAGSIIDVNVSRATNGANFNLYVGTQFNVQRKTPLSP